MINEIQPKRKWWNLGPLSFSALSRFSKCRRHVKNCQPFKKFSKFKKLLPYVIQHIKRGDFVGEVNFEFFIWCIKRFFFLSALKWNLIKVDQGIQIFQLQKRLKILIVFFIIFWMFSLISENDHSHKVPTCKVPSYNVLNHIFVTRSRGMSHMSAVFKFDFSI